MTVPRPQAGATPRPAAAVHADLRIEVDGSPVTVTGDGQRVTVTAADARALWSAGGPDRGLAGIATRRRALARTATALAGLGLTTTVAGPAGTLLEAGADVRPSRLARLLTGSPHVRFGRTAAFVRTIRSHR